MKKLHIYLDTSIISFLYADDTPEKRDATKEFFDKFVKYGVYNVFISSIVFDEIRKTQNSKLITKLLDAVEKYELPELDISEDMENIQALAEIYIKNNVIPRKKLDDALHIAIATVKQMDVLLSWNYKHLANVNRETLVQSINLRMGYIKPLRMITPLEVLYESD